MTQFTISDLVRETNVPASSIHHYLRLGLLPPPQRSSANKFFYDDRHQRALLAIRTLRQKSKISLEQIRLLLPELVNAPQRLEDMATSEESTKSALLDAAIEAFGEQSYGEVSVADLTQRAGIAKGSFYKHFGSKQEVFLAAAEEVGFRAAAAFQELMEQAGTSGTETGADEAGSNQPNPAELLAQCLSPGLAVFLELAKRAMQDEPEHVEQARQVFHGLADRIGQVLVDSDDAYRHGGALIMDSIAHVFYDLMAGMADS